MTATDGFGGLQQERLPERVYPWDQLPGPAYEPRREQSLRDLTRRIARRRWLLLAVFVVVVSAVTAYVFLATPRYRSSARLRIETQQQGPAALSALTEQAGSVPGGNLLGLGRDELETEIAVLRSDRVSDATIDSLAIGVRLLTPNTRRSTIFTARVVQPDVDIDGRLTLTRAGNGHYRVERSGLSDVEHLPTEIVAGVPVQIGGTMLTLAPALLTGGPQRIELKFLARYEVHKLLDRRLSIARQEGGSRLVEVSFEDPDRFFAAQVVNTLVNEYVTYTKLTDQRKDTTTVAQLRFEVDSMARKLGQAEATLRAFEERSRIIAPEEQATAEVKRISAISAHVDEVSTERNALARLLALIEQRSRGGADATAYRQLATFPSLITNRAIQDLLQSLVTLENKRSELSVKRTENNAEYKQYSDRIAEIERQLHTTGAQYLESLDHELNTTVSTVRALSDSLQLMPAAATQYVRLLRDRTLNEALYLALQKQLKQAELRDVLRQDKVQIVDTPRVANRDDAAFPKKAVLIALGIVLGIVAALTAALFAELWSSEPPAAAPSQL